MSGKEFLKFAADYRKLGKDNRMQEMMDRFELNPKGKIKKMSKGMKQNRFIELIAEEKIKGKTILLSSHMFEEVERTCDRIGIIRAGKLVTVDSVETLRERHMHTYTVTLDTPEMAHAFSKDFGGTCNGVNVTVSAKQSLETILWKRKWKTKIWKCSEMRLFRRQC